MRDPSCKKECARGSLRIERIGSKCRYMKKIADMVQRHNNHDRTPDGVDGSDAKPGFCGNHADQVYGR